MRMVLAVLVSAVCAGFMTTAMARTIQEMDGLVDGRTSERPAATRLSENLPSDVEQRLGIPPNSANPGYGRGRGGPSEFEPRRGYRRRYGGPEVERCEGIAYQRGLVGRDFRRFVRYCMER